MVSPELLFSDVPLSLSLLRFESAPCTIQSQEKAIQTSNMGSTMVQWESGFGELSVRKEPNSLHS